MRVQLILIAGLILVPIACSSRGGTPPPSFDKQLLTGKWKNTADANIVIGYEFAADGALKLSIRGMEHPIPGKYSWTGDRTLDLEYQPTAEMENAYEEVAKAYKDDVNARIKAGTLNSKAGPSMLAAVPDKWPASESFTAAISDQGDKGKMLMLNNASGTSRSFEKAN